MPGAKSSLPERHKAAPPTTSGPLEVSNHSRAQQAGPKRSPYTHFDMYELLRHWEIVTHENYV